MNTKLKKLFGNRLRSEFNDLKRTPEVISKELSIDISLINDILEGKSSVLQINNFLKKIEKKYPIDVYDLYLIRDDCENGIKILKNKDSKNSSRIFERKLKSGIKIPYYEYRDTSMSKLGPFKPEWIRELSLVNNSDPENQSVVYNNGHFLHQMTFFIGEVNFYWIENGKKFCKEMNTGDSNYISPFYPHSFTSRNPKKDGIIIAVTFGGNVRRAQKELYWLGENRVKKFMQLAKKRYGNNKTPVITSTKNQFKNFKTYSIKELASHEKLTYFRGFEILIKKRCNCDKIFESEYHGYLFNFGSATFIFKWSLDGKKYQKNISPGDSVYIQPFISYSFCNESNENVNLIIYEVSGTLSQETQSELSLFNENDRIANEYMSWF